MALRMAPLLLLLTFSIGCGSSSYSPPASPSPTPSGPSTSVSIVNGASAMTTGAYAPNPAMVAVGTTVIWTNNDSRTHTSTATGGAWNSGSIAPGGVFSRTFTAAGIFDYYCTIHPGMVGTVRVQ